MSEDKIAGLTLNYHFKRIPNENFDSSSVRNYKSDSGKILKVLSYNDLSKANAVALVADRKEALRRIFQRSVDPYFGTEHPANESVLKQFEKERDPNSENMGLLGQLHLGASKNFVLSSFDAANSFYEVQILYQYCSAMQALFELRFFSHGLDSRPIVVSCTN